MPRATALWQHAAAVILLAAMLLWPAAYNGYPLLYPDSPLYVALSFAPQEYAPRVLSYPLLMHAMHWGLSLWLVIAVQALVTAWVLHEAVVVFAVQRCIAWLLGLGIVLTLFTGLPWTVDQVMPDFMAPLLMLAMLITTVHSDRLSAPRRIVLLAIVAIGVAVHPSHAPLAFGLILFAAIAGRWLRLKWRLLPAMLAALCGVALAVGANWIVSGHPYYSQGGQQYLFGRLVDDGIVADYLAQACPEKKLRLCDFRDSLPPTHNQYLWTHPAAFEAMGGWNASPELQHILADSIARMPLRHLGAIVTDTARQVVRMHLGDSLNRPSAAGTHIVEVAFPGEAVQLHDSLQATARLKEPIGWFDLAQWPLQLAATALLAALAFIQARRGEIRSAGFCLLVLGALLINAFICGVFSGASNRYQSRVAWLAPAAIGLLIAGRKRDACPGVEQRS